MKATKFRKLISVIFSIVLISFVITINSILTYAINFDFQKVSEGENVTTAVDEAKKIYGENDNLEKKEEGKYKAFPVITGNKSEYLKKLIVNNFTLPKGKVITVGETDVIEPTFTPKGATSNEIKWHSSDESVATVSSTGEVGIINAISKGTTTITAELKANGKTITKTTELRVASKARDTVLVLDVSGSMNGTPLEEMKKSAIQFCKDLLIDEYNNRVGIVFYNDEIDSVDLTNDLDMLISKIEKVDDGSRTNMQLGLSKADEILNKQSKKETIKNVVIMADGLPNEGEISDSGSMPYNGNSYGYSKDTGYANAVIDTTQDMMKKYNLYSLGFFHSMSGEDKDFASALMSALTNKSDGYHEVEQAEDLQFAFGDISDDIAVGSKIVINIACPVDVTVSYNGETLCSAKNSYSEKSSFGTLKLLGKDKDIKVLSLDSDKVYDINVVGTGEGTMNYSVNYFDDDENMTDYRSFESVPITNSTVIKSNTKNDSEDVSLNIDEDGDGEIDTVWTAGSKGKGKITYEKEPPKEESSQEESSVLENVESDDNSIVIITLIVLVIIISIIIIIVAIWTSQKPKKEDIIKDSNYNEPKLDVVQCGRCGQSYFTSVQCSCDGKGCIRIISDIMSEDLIEFEPNKALNVGKDKKWAKVVIPNEFSNVSRIHCTITYDINREKYYVVDLSSNGTYIGKIRLKKNTRTAIEPGTEICLANDKCKILLL